MIPNRISLKLNTAPAIQPVALAVAKEFLKIDGNDTSEANTVSLFIEAATQWAEAYTKRKFITQTWELTKDMPAQADYGYNNNIDGYGYSLPYGMGNYIELPLAPVQSVTSFKYYDLANTEATYSSDNYFVDTAAGRLCLNSGQTFPANIRPQSGIKITYVVGYGVNATDVPAAIRQAILEHVFKMYECRVMSCDASDTCKSILDAYKLYDNLGLC